MFIRNADLTPIKKLFVVVFPGLFDMKSVIKFETKQNDLSNNNLLVTIL